MGLTPSPAYQEPHLGDLPESGSPSLGPRSRVPALMAAGERRIFYGYAIVAVAFVLTFSSGPGQTFTFSVFQPEILRSTGISATTFSLIYALGSGFSAIVVLILGRSLDRFGARASTFALAVLLFLSTVGMFFANGFLSLLLALALLRAIGQGCLPTTAQVLTSNWFTRKRGRALSLGTMGVVTANAILPPLSYYLIEHIGWRATYLWFGSVLGGSILLLAWLVIRNRPEDMGLFPDGDSSAPDEPNDSDKNPSAGSSSKKRIWLTGQFWSLALPLSVPPFVGTSVVFHQVSLFEAQGLSSQSSANALSVLAIASGAGTLTAGWFLDRVGVRNTTVLMLGLLSLAMILLATLSSATLVIPYSLCLGAAIGLWAVTNGATWPHYYGRKGLGSVQGSAATILLFAAAVAPLPLALAHSVTATHTVGISLLLATSLIAVAITAPRRRKRSG